MKRLSGIVLAGCVLLGVLSGCSEKPPGYVDVTLPERHSTTGPEDLPTGGDADELIRETAVAIKKAVKKLEKENIRPLALDDVEYQKTLLQAAAEDLPEGFDPTLLSIEMNQTPTGGFQPAFITYGPYGSRQTYDLALSGNKALKSIKDPSSRTKTCEIFYPDHWTPAVQVGNGLNLVAPEGRGEIQVQVKAEKLEMAGINGQKTAGFLGIQGYNATAFEEGLIVSGLPALRMDYTLLVAPGRQYTAYVIPKDGQTVVIIVDMADADAGTAYEADLRKAALSVQILK